MAIGVQTQLELPVKKKQILYKLLPHIMIIDDDPEILEELREYLSSDYEVETLFDSANAFEVACELSPDLIILDLKMFPKSGFQLAYEFKNSVKTKFIPIIAITGFFTEKEHELMVKLSGVKRFLLKPFNLDQFEKEIKSVLKEFNPRNN